MVKVYRRLKQENMQSKLIMQVHDELIIEAPEKDKEKVAFLLKEIFMKSVVCRNSCESVNKFFVAQ